MATRRTKNNGKEKVYEVLMIVFIWLVVLSFLYIIFWKAKTGLNL